MTLAVTQVSAASLSDSELASRIELGDTRAFELVMRRHNRLLYRTARSILRNDAEAEDCLQEAYFQAFRSMAGFRAKAKLSTWLTRIVINQALARLRRDKTRDASVSLDNVVDIDGRVAGVEATQSGPAQPDAAVVREELRRLLERHIDQLPTAFRTVFVLRALEELSVEETAATLGIPDATVRTRFFRARSLLRETLEGEVDTALADAFAFEGARCDRIVASVLHRLPSALGAGPGG